jgi:hypothetical protein
MKPVTRLTFLVILSIILGALFGSCLGAQSPPGRPTLAADSPDTSRRTLYDGPPPTEPGQPFLFQLGDNSELYFDVTDSLRYRFLDNHGLLLVQGQRLRADSSWSVTSIGVVVGDSVDTIPDLPPDTAVAEVGLATVLGAWTYRVPGSGHILMAVGAAIRLPIGSSSERNKVRSQ